jgi:hypothetical protein
MVVGGAVPVIPPAPPTTGQPQGEIVPAAGEFTPFSPAAPFVETYVFAPNENARAVADISARVGGLFGPFGEMAGWLVGGAFGLWGWYRTTRQRKTAETLVNIIETGRVAMQGLPRGGPLHQEWLRWMIEQQAVAGVHAEVKALLPDSEAARTAQVIGTRLAERVMLPPKN